MYLKPITYGWFVSIMGCLGVLWPNMSAIWLSRQSGFLNTWPAVDRTLQDPVQNGVVFVVGGRVVDLWRNDILQQEPHWLGRLCL